MRMWINIGLALLIQLALLGYMIWDRVSILTDGREIELKVEPVDPRSLFRGDYVILTYAISDLNTSALEGDDDFSRGDRIFVELILVGGKWQPVAIFHDKPTTNSTVIIAGTVDSAYPASTPVPNAEDRNEKPLSGTDLNISYGVESYFVPEGEGRDLETARNAERMSVILAVRQDGTAAIKKLLIDGQVFYEEGLL